MRFSGLITAVVVVVVCVFVCVVVSDGADDDVDEGDDNADACGAVGSDGGGRSLPPQVTMILLQSTSAFEERYCCSRFTANPMTAEMLSEGLNFIKTVSSGRMSSGRSLSGKLWS